MTNDAPDVGQLNPYDTSTDPLYVSTGNPMLKPQNMSFVSLNYTFSRSLGKGLLYLSPNVYYKAITDMITPGGYTDDGIYHSNYVNCGGFSQTYASAMVSYGMNWGRFYCGGGWGFNKYRGQSPRHMLLANAGFNARYRNFSFYCDVSYQSEENSEFSRTTLQKR